jgi:hypothetical protein
MREWAKYGAIGLAGGLIGYVLQPAQAPQMPTAPTATTVIVQEVEPAVEIRYVEREARPVPTDCVVMRWR